MCSRGFSYSSKAKKPCGEWVGGALNFLALSAARLSQQLSRENGCFAAKTPSLETQGQSVGSGKKAAKVFENGNAETLTWEKG